MKNALSSGWETVELGDVTVCLDGERIPLNSEDRSKMKGNIPYYGANGQIDSINKHIFNEELLLLAEDGGSWGPHQKCSYIINGKSWVNNHAHVLKMKKGTDISYLMYFLNHHDLNQFISGTTRGKLNQGVMKKIPIILPPLHVQKQIVSLLEKAEKLKEIRDEADKLTKEYLKAVFLEMFRNFEDSEILGNHILFLTSGSRGWAKYYSESGDVFLRIENVGRNQLNTENVVYVKAPNTQEAKRTKVEPRDILLSITADLGRTCVIPSEFPRAFINQHLAILRLDKLLDPMFVAQYLTSNKGMTQINKLSKGGTKDGLNFTDIRSIKVPMPPIKLQKDFANIVYRYEKIKEYQKQSQEQIHNLFNNILQKSFKGELAC
ncbi:MAG: restriction endonuclease subunit S [Candidatus Nitrosotalea sp.]|nr:restriction endonuclease subunit S [Candidatus Nitrosotalea sp.]